MSARVAQAAVLLAAFGCSSNEVWELPFPTIERAKTTFLIFELDDGPAVFVFDVTEPIGTAELPTFFAVEAPVRVTAIGSPEPIGRFPFGTGRVNPTTASPSSPLPLGALRTAELPSPRADPWDEVAELPAALQALRLPGERTPCRSYRPEPLPLPDGSCSVAGVAALDDRRVLVVPYCGPYYVYDATAETLTPIETAPDAPRGEAFRDRFGAIWIYGNQLGASRAFPSPTGFPDARGFTHASSSAVYHTVDPGEPGADGRVLFTTEYGVVEVIEGGVARRVAEGDVGAFARALVEADGVIASGHRSGATLRLFGPGRPERTIEPLGPSVGFTAGRTSAALGAWVASGLGGLHRFDGERLTAIDGPRGENKPSLITYVMEETLGPDGEAGMALFGSLGVFGFYFEGYGFCPSQTGGTTSFTAIAPAGPDWIVLLDQETQPRRLRALF